MAPLCFDDPELERVLQSTFTNVSADDHVLNLFPQVFYHPNTQDVLDTIQDKHYDDSSRRWSSWDSLVQDGMHLDDALATFLNDLTVELHSGHRIHDRGIWTKKIPRVSSNEGSSTFVYCQERTWGRVRWHMERYDTGDGNKALAFQNLVEGADCIATHQQNRTFSIGILWCEDEFQMCTFDPAGVVVSSPVNIHERPELLLHFLVGILVFPPALIGYDGSIRPMENAIWCGHEKYDIIQYHQKRNWFMGRRTQCFIVKDKAGQRFAIKDTWVRTEYAVHEAKMLEHLGDVEGIPHLAAKSFVDFTVIGDDGEIVHSVQDNTFRHRAFISDDDDNWARVSYADRVHCRLVMGPVGVPLRCFGSRSEFVGSFIDVLEGE